MTNEKTYNGWTNYETWAVKLWMDNDQGSCDYWQNAARDAWTNTADKTPNQFMDHNANARMALADHLKDYHDDDSEHPVFAVANGTVYADLLNAALSEVDWREIAGALLTDLAENDDTVNYEVSQ